jgi:hypothetical protein
VQRLPVLECRFRTRRVEVVRREPGRTVRQEVKFTDTTDRLRRLVGIELVVSNRGYLQFFAGVQDGNAVGIGGRAC